MKVIVAGSRGITDFDLVVRCIEQAPFEITELVSGRCRLGVDALGERWARARGLPIKPFPAPWRDRFGTLDSRAGFRRNYDMSLYADALIAVWDGESHGTAQMCDCMRQAKKPLYLHSTKGYEHLFAGC